MEAFAGTDTVGPVTSFPALDRLSAGLDNAADHLDNDERMQATHWIGVSAAQIPVLIALLPSPFGLSFEDWYRILKRLGRRLTAMYDWTSFGAEEEKALAGVCYLVKRLEQLFPEGSVVVEYPPAGRWQAQHFASAIRRINAYLSRAEAAVHEEDWYAFRMCVLKIERLKEKIYKGLPNILGVRFTDWYELICGIDVDPCHGVPCSSHGYRDNVLVGTWHRFALDAQALTSGCSVHAPYSAYVFRCYSVPWHVRAIAYDSNFHDHSPLVILSNLSINSSIPISVTTSGILSSSASLMASGSTFSGCR